MNGINKHKKQKSKNKSKKPLPPTQNNDNNKPGWNNDINNLGKYKLSSADLLKRKINLISKNLLEAKKELQENYQESLIQSEKKKAKSPNKEARFKPIKEKKQINQNKSTSISRPASTKLPVRTTSHTNKTKNLSKKAEPNLINSIESEETDAIEFKPAGNIISTQNKKPSKKSETQNYKTNYSPMENNDLIYNKNKNQRQNSNDSENKMMEDYQEDEEEEDNEEMYSENLNPNDVKNELNDEIVNKFDNLNSIEESMKKLNQILEISSKNSLKNRYTYGVENEYSEFEKKDQLLHYNNYSKLNMDRKEIDPDENYLPNEDNKIENNINYLEKELQILKEKFKFKDDLYNNEIQREQHLENNYIHQRPIINDNNPILSHDFMEETPMTLPKMILNNKVIPKANLENKPTNVLVFDNDNFKNSNNRSKRLDNDSKVIVVPKPKVFTNNPIKEEPQLDDNINYIKNLLLQTQSDIKNMNNQLSEYTNKIQSNKSTNNSIGINSVLSKGFLQNK